MNKLLIRRDFSDENSKQKMQRYYLSELHCPLMNGTPIFIVYKGFGTLDGCLCFGI